MAKKFNIHDWQAKQTQKRLDELQIKKVVDQSMNNADIGDLMNIVRNYDLGKVLNTLAVIIDRTGGMPEVAQKIADLVPGIEQKFNKDGSKNVLNPGDNEPVSSKFSEPMGEHHGDDFPKGLLKKSVNSFLGQLKKKSEIDYDKVEDIMKKHFNIDEMSTTGTGASFQAGDGEGYMTPNAFKKKNKK